MNDDQYSFLERLLSTTGPSGYEENAQQVWRERVQDTADTVETDVLGNCFAVLNPSGRPRLMLDAHIDEIGFIVKYVDDNGFLYFSPIGGLDPSTLAGNRVRILGKRGPVMGVIGRKAIHLTEPEERKKAPELKNMWIDIGASGRDEAESLVGVGDGGGRYALPTRLQGNLVTSAALDDRIGSYIVAETFRSLAETSPNAAVFAVSSVQEELGLRGATASAYHVDADVGIAVDVHWTSDHPQAPKTEIGDIRVGAGALLFRGFPSSQRVYGRLVDAARAESVAFQVDSIDRRGGTDANVMQLSRGGMATSIVGIPTRYLHTASEVISTDDADACVAILTRFARDLTEDVDLIPRA